MPSNQNPFAILLANNLRVGSVIYKHCDFTTPPKPKYVVVASINPRLLILLINSEINQFYTLQGLDQFHVPVSVADHGFLHHDSYANCVEAHTSFDYTDVRQEVIDDYNNIFKGWLTDPCLESVYHAVKNNNMIRRGHQKEIITSIEQQLPHLQSTTGN